MLKPSETAPNLESFVPEVQTETEPEQFAPPPVCAPGGNPFDSQSLDFWELTSSQEKLLYERISVQEKSVASNKKAVIPKELQE